jgi:hypothetical protein
LHYAGGYADTDAPKSPEVLANPRTPTYGYHYI